MYMIREGQKSQPRAADRALPSKQSFWLLFLTFSEMCCAARSEFPSWLLLDEEDLNSLSQVPNSWETEFLHL